MCDLKYTMHHGRAVAPQEKEEQVSSALQQVTTALAERTQREQSFMERYVATLDDNQQLLADQYIADAANYNALTDKCMPCLFVLHLPMHGSLLVCCGSAWCAHAVSVCAC